MAPWEDAEQDAFAIARSLHALVAAGDDDATKAFVRDRLHPDLVARTRTRSGTTDAGARDMLLESLHNELRDITRDPFYPFPSLPDLALQCADWVFEVRTKADGPVIQQRSEWAAWRHTVRVCLRRDGDHWAFATCMPRPDPTLPTAPTEPFPALASAASDHSADYCPAGMALIPPSAQPRSRGGLKKWTCIARTEISVHDWAVCVAAGTCEWPDEDDEERFTALMGNDDLPMNFLGAEAAEAYCRSRGWRLPTAAEWHWARESADPTFDTPWGSAHGVSADPTRPGALRGVPGLLCRWAEYRALGNLDHEDMRPCPLATHPADTTRQGLSDMVANLEEWVRNYKGDGVCRVGDSFFDADPSLLAVGCGGSASSGADWQYGARCAADPSVELPTMPAIPCFLPEDGAREEALDLARALHRLIAAGDQTGLALLVSAHLDPSVGAGPRGPLGFSKVDARAAWQESVTWTSAALFKGGAAGESRLAPLPPDVDIVLECEDWRFHLRAKDGGKLLRDRSDPTKGVDLCLYRHGHQWTLGC